MKQIIQNVRTGRLRVVDVPEPQVSAGHVLVRTTASLISAGTERMVVDFAKKSLVGKARSRPDLVRKVLDKARRDGLGPTLRAALARLDEPLPLGYSAAGQIIAVGKGLEGRFRVGQRVAMAGAGIANHAEVNVVPAPLIAPVPDDVLDEEAAFGTVAAIALHGVRNLRPNLGDVVAVIGVGLIGLLAVQQLALSGVRVIALDIAPDRLALARRLGAEWQFKIDDDGAVPAILAATGGLGADGALVTAATESSEPLKLAADIARDRACIAVVGKTGTEFPFAEFMKKELSIVVSRSYGPGRYDTAFESGRVTYPPGFVRWTETENLAECLRLMSRSMQRRLIVDALITHRFDIERAEAAYDLVLDGQEPHLGVVVQYPHINPSRDRLAFAAPAARSGACRVGVIGAGAFAHAILLPALAKAEGVEFATVVTARGMTAERARAAMGFASAATDPQVILDDLSINAVLVLTPHEHHASIACRALERDKAVFVEKPLATTRADLAAVAETRQRSAGFLTVGFNRRFAALTHKALQRLQDLAGPRVILIRVNAGPAATHDRILGEMCHFVDLARHLVGAPILWVSAAAATTSSSSGADNVTATLSFADGSMATIVYTGLGDAAFAKELIEIYAAGQVIRIDDFRSLTVIAGGRTHVERDRLGQDKGHKAEIAAFVAAVRGLAPPPVEESELLETSLATIAVLESLQGGGRIEL